MGKKNILFVNHSLHSGGVEKSLITLLSLFDYDRYDIDLQLFIHKGLFMDKIPHEVNLLPPLLPEEYSLNIRKAFFELLKNKMPVKAICRILITLTTHSGSLGTRLKSVYQIEKFMLSHNPKKYDAVVAFMEGEPLYYAVDKTNSNNKIGFIHGDYRAMNLNEKFDKKFIDHLTALCTVSQACKDSLDEVFPESENQHYVIYNIISEKILTSLAKNGRGFDDGFDGKRILTIARLSYQKGLDIGINAIALLACTNFKWYIIGMGPLEKQLKSQVTALGLSDKIIFIGETANPYPYIAECDLYFQPSRFEGKAIAVDEACVFKKPMVLGEYSTACDQIESDQEGLICKLTPQALAQGLDSLINDQNLCNKFSTALSKKQATNEDEIEKLYNIINNPFI